MDKKKKEKKGKKSSRVQQRSSVKEAEEPQKKGKSMPSLKKLFSKLTKKKKSKSSKQEQNEQNEADNWPTATILSPNCDFTQIPRQAKNYSPWDQSKQEYKRAYMPTDTIHHDHLPPHHEASTAPNWQREPGGQTSYRRHQHTTPRRPQDPSQPHNPAAAFRPHPQGDWSPVHVDLNDPRHRRATPVQSGPPTVVHYHLNIHNCDGLQLHMDPSRPSCKVQQDVAAAAARADPDLRRISWILTPDSNVYGEFQPQPTTNQPEVLEHYQASTDPMSCSHLDSQIDISGAVSAGLGQASSTVPSDVSLRPFNEPNQQHVHTVDLASAEPMRAQWYESETASEYETLPGHYHPPPEQKQVDEAYNANCQPSQPVLQYQVSINHQDVCDDSNVFAYPEVEKPVDLGNLGDDCGVGSFNYGAAHPSFQEDPTVATRLLNQKKNDFVPVTDTAKLSFHPVTRMMLEPDSQQIYVDDGRDTWSKTAHDIANENHQFSTNIVPVCQSEDKLVEFADTAQNRFGCKSENQDTPSYIKQAKSVPVQAQKCTALVRGGSIERTQHSLYKTHMAPEASCSQVQNTCERRPSKSVAQCESDTSALKTKKSEQLILVNDSTQTTLPRNILRSDDKGSTDNSTQTTLPRKKQARESTTQTSLPRGQHNVDQRNRTSSSTKGKQAQRGKEGKPVAVVTPRIHEDGIDGWESDDTEAEIAGLLDHMTNNQITIALETDLVTARLYNMSRRGERGFATNAHTEQYPEYTQASGTQAPMGPPLTSPSNRHPNARWYMQTQSQVPMPPQEGSASGSRTETSSSGFVREQLEQRRSRQYGLARGPEVAQASVSRGGEGQSVSGAGVCPHQDATHQVSEATHLQPQFVTPFQRHVAGRQSNPGCSWQDQEEFLSGRMQRRAASTRTRREAEPSPAWTAAGDAQPGGAGEADTIGHKLARIKPGLIRVPGVLLVGLDNDRIVVTVSPERSHVADVSRFMRHHGVALHEYECGVLARRYRRPNGQPSRNTRVA